MKKSIMVAALAWAIFLVPAVWAAEPVTLTEALEAQEQACGLGQAPVVGERWQTCEQYIYEAANLAGVGARQTEIRALQAEILKLLAAIDELI